MAGGAKPPLILDQGLVDEVIEWIEAGTTDYVAAESVGMSQSTFYRYMKYGEMQVDCDENPELVFEELLVERFPWAAGKDWVKAEHRDMYATFYNRVMTARATCRRKMEKAVTQLDPFKWLRYGPGRERPGRPGWGDAIAVTNEGGSERPVQIEVVDYRQAISPLRPPDPDEE